MLHFMARLHLGRAGLRSDGEVTLAALKAKVKDRRKEPTDVSEGSLKDSQSKGGIEGPSRWWQAHVRTLRFDLEARYGTKVIVDNVVWRWLTRRAAWVAERYRTRADGLTSHYAAFGNGYKGEVLPSSETAFFNMPMTHSRQVTENTTAHKGDSTFVRGIWVGKHEDSNDHIYLTETGWHRARTVRRMEESKRADAKLFKEVCGAPWDPRAAQPTRNPRMQDGGACGGPAVAVPAEAALAEAALQAAAAAAAEPAAAEPERLGPVAEPVLAAQPAEEARADADMEATPGQKREAGDAGAGGDEKRMRYVRGGRVAGRAARPLALRDLRERGGERPHGPRPGGGACRGTQGIGDEAFPRLRDETAK